MPGPEQLELIDASPSKEFFISMITRDITVVDSILDLVDNAVDKIIERTSINVMAKVLEGSKVNSLKGSRISVEVSESTFEITDNSGGISVTEARESAFRFGNPSERGASRGLSVYGIGMKRAFFKLGNHISMESRTPEDFFRVEIPVQAWEREDHWDFRFAAHGKNVDPSSVTGTRIRITELHGEVANQFAELSFRQRLCDRIAITYSLFLKAGLLIEVNGRRLNPTLPVFATDLITPARRRFELDGVDILVLAGVTPRTDRTQRGWYAFCNGRMVAEADKTALTGWGRGDYPQWHTKYGHFLGFVAFTSEDVRRLPWTTTKRGLVEDLAAYREAVREMQTQGRPVLDFLNRLYPGDVDADIMLQREVMGGSHSSAMDSLPKTDSAFRVKRLERIEEKDPIVNVQFRRKNSDLERIRKYFPKLANSGAGKIASYALDYFMNRECPK